MAESEEVTPEGIAISPTGNRMLMDTIRNYRAIYDKSCHEYKDQRVKKNAWQAVANTLKIDVASAQQRYNNIRTNFSTYIKSLKGKSGSGRDDLVNIRPDYEYLRWLCSHIKHRQTRSNMRRTDSPICSEEIEAQGGGSDDGNEPENETTSSDDGQGTSDTQISLLQDSSDGSLKQDDTTSTADESDRSLGKDINKVVKKFNKSHLEQPFTSKGEKRPWSKQGQSDVFEREVSKTMKSINLALSNEKKGRDDDEDTLFCLSLVQKFKRIPQKYKSTLQLNVLKAFNDMEWSLEQQEGRVVQQMAGPQHQSTPLTPLSHWYQQQQYNLQQDYPNI